MVVREDAMLVCHVFKDGCKMDIRFLLVAFLLAWSEESAAWAEES